jgi:hypothetical protein
MPMWIATMALVAALACADQPPPPPATPAPVAPKPAKPPPKDRSQEIVCEDHEELGSLFSHRVCATRAQWEARRVHDQEDISHQRDEMGKSAGSQ